MRLTADFLLGHGDKCGEDCEHGRKEDRWLGTWEEVPEYQRNPHILRYYRLERPRYRHFWRGHNEFGNMWTHLFAAVVMALRFVRWLQEPVASAATTWTHVFYCTGIFLFFVASIAVFAVSVQYHWRMCSTEKDVRCWHCVDVPARTDTMLNRAREP